MKWHNDTEEAVHSELVHLDGRRVRYYEWTFSASRTMLLVTSAASLNANKVQGSLIEAVNDMH